MAGWIFDRLLGRLRAASDLTAGDGDLPAGKLAAYFTPLAKADRSLPAAAARYVAAGDNASIILTLQATAAQQSWRNRIRSWPDQNGAALFGKVGKWRIDQMQRFGEVLTALQPITSDWGYYGTKKSPDWLRQVVSLWLGRGTTNQPISVLAELAAQAGDPVATVLDIIFARDPHNYQATNAAARFAGMGD